MNEIFKQWSYGLVPVTINDKLDGAGKKVVMPSPWRDGQVYTAFNKNSVALRTGETVNVVDVDTKDLSLLPDVWEDWCEERLMLEDTLIVESRNGYHFYFKAPFKVRSTTKTDAVGTKIPYVDFRGEGGLIFIHSTSKAASYDVLCDSQPITALGEIENLIPRFAQVIPKAQDAGFVNLDTGEAVTIEEASNDLKRSLEEVVAMIELLSPAVPRATWMMYMASAYNLIDSKPNRLEAYLRSWSKEGADAEHKFTDKGFNLAWDEISSGRYGKAFKGGTLVKEASEKGYVDEATQATEQAQEDKYNRYCDNIKACGSVKEIKDLFNAKSDWKKAPLCTELQAKTLPSLCKSHATTLGEKTVVEEYKHLTALPKKKRKEIGDVKFYYCDNRFNIVRGDTLVEAVNSNALHIYGSSWGYDVEDFTKQGTQDAELIQGIKKETDYMADDEVTFKLLASRNPAELDFLHVFSNPLHDTQAPAERTDIVEDFFTDIWNGKAEDIIRMIGLSMRFKETKLNKIHVVAPSNVGKTTFLANIGFQEITMKRLLPAINAEKGIGVGVVNSLKSSGLLLIDEANKPLTEDIKNIDGYIYLDQFGQGGTQEIKLHYTCMTSTHKTAVRGMSDEMYNRLLLVELGKSEVKHTLDKSKLFTESTDEYTEAITQHSKWLLKDALVNPKYTHGDLLTLQANYRLELNSEVDDLLSEISEDIVAEFKALSSRDGDVIYRNDTYYVKRKGDLADAIHNRFSEYSHIDDGKYLEKLSDHFFTGATKSFRIDGKPLKYHELQLRKFYADHVSDDEKAIEGFSDLDLEEL